MKIIRNIRKYSVIFFAVLFGFSISAFLDYTFDRTSPIEYRHAKALSNTVEQGGQIDIQFGVERFRNAVQKLHVQ